MMQSLLKRRESIEARPAAKEGEMGASDELRRALREWKGV